ncbi:MAG: hypothetical protein IJN58_02280 [Clostridia bacterium]|nr:hypothetical protein [Clostridia bacterium]
MKNCKKLAALVLAVLMLMGLAACKQSEENALLVGVWELEETLVNGKAEEGEVAEVVFEFKKNGKGSRSTGGKEDFTFESDYDGQICTMKNVINANGTIGTSGQFEIKVDGDTMTIRTEGKEDTVEIVFVKQ